MKRLALRACALAAAAVLSVSTASANDIIDFLKAINNVNRGPVYHPAAVGGVAHRHGSGFDLDRRSDLYRQRSRFDRPLTSRDVSRLSPDRGRLLHDSHYRGSHLTGRHSDFGSCRTDRFGYGHDRLRSGVSIQVGLNSGYQYPALPPQPVIPQPYVVPSVPQPAIVNPLALPHQLGEIVDCPVPLETCVKIEDPHNIAPNARPVAVAVRDPHLCRHGCSCCTERIVYVEVCIPPCPLQRLTVSPCRTKIRMDFGTYEVDIESRNDMITIDYDD